MIVVMGVTVTEFFDAVANYYSSHQIRFVDVTHTQNTVRSKSKCIRATVTA